MSAEKLPDCELSCYWKQRNSSGGSTRAFFSAFEFGRYCSSTDCRLREERTGGRWELAHQDVFRSCRQLLCALEVRDDGRRTLQATRKGCLLFVWRHHSSIRLCIEGVLRIAVGILTLPAQA